MQGWKEQGESNIYSESNEWHTDGLVEAGFYLHNLKIYLKKVIFMDI